MWWLFLPLIVLGVLVVVFGLLVFLSRFRNGALLKPMIMWLSRFGFMQRFFKRISEKAIERQNPELAGAIRKMQSVATNPSPQAAQKAMSRLTAAERRAYMEAMQEQQGETGNRQMRRKLQQQTRGSRPGGGGTSGRKRKRR